ncbi:hypothetical protein [Achromobacter pestifer]
MYFKVPTYINKSAGGVVQESNTVRCIRILEERTSSGQRKQITVMTLNRWDNELPQQALDTFTPEERKQWETWKAEHDKSHQLDQAGRELGNIAQALTLSALAIREGVGQLPDPAAIWTALDAFTAALKASDQPRPKRPRGRPRLPE